MENKCIICGKDADTHHIKTRGSGGGEEPYNKIFLCRFHHSEVHQLGNVKFAQIYYQYENYLLDNGWEYIKHINKWKHD